MPNRLALAQSLYLRKHQDNPIDWWSWGAEALAQAKTENKPIFLSIGYSSCHWCTVMEGEAFANGAIAEFMNANFIPVKVDREERPDLDSIYMQALQMMTGQGGWPLNIFLTPDKLIPFYGGTYFPVQPRYGRPGFLQILEAVRRFYDIEKDKLQKFTQEIIQNLQQATILPTASADSLTKELLHRGIEINTAVISPKDLAGPSFPMIPYAALALRGTRFEHESSHDGSNLSRQRGEDLILGGIFDHVGGGFHRYTVDSSWTVPHFEKMLYDNGQILEYLANLWRNGVKEPAIKRAVAKTVTWLRREMTAPEGYFYAAQDADSFINSTATEPEEGAFYVWDYSELEELFTTEEIAQLQTAFTITPPGNFEGHNVLQRLQKGKLPPSLEQILVKMFTLRYGQTPVEIVTFPPARNNREAKAGNWSGRIPPVTDTKMIAAWNSLVISGLATAYTAFGEESYLILAKNAANFILQRQWIDGRFYRLNYDGQPAVSAQAEDYALFIKALLDLHAASPTEDTWLETAVRIQQEFDDLLWSIEMGGYYNNAEDSGQDLLIRERDYNDNAVPSANGVAISSLVRLALLTDNLDYLDQAEQTLQAFATVLEKSPQACPSLFTALDWFIYGTSVKTTAEHLLPLIPQYLPTTVYSITSDLPPDEIALVCQGSACLEPAQTPEQLLAQINQISCQGQN